MKKTLNVSQKLGWRTLYRDTRLAAIFFLGFSSGLPFLLILQTLSLWLTECEVNKTTIGLFAWVTFPYTIKFLFAPLLARWKLPVLHSLLGLRRSWLLVTQLGLAFSIYKLGGCNPCHDLAQVAFWALIVGVCSACQDIIFEAYRIEYLDKHQLGLGASASVLGYRAGLFCAGAGAFYLAYYLGWHVAYQVMGACVLVGILTTFLCGEPAQHKTTYALQPNASLRDYLSAIFIHPLQSLLAHRQHLWLMALFIVSFKLVDTVLNVMSMPFLFELGFSKLEIAHVAKTFGYTMMILGCIGGGFFLSKYSLYRLLLICGFFQLVASLLFVGQAVFGHQLEWLFITMGCEHLCLGMSQVALIAYLSQLCQVPFVASHYALLSSFASLVRVSISGVAGWMADHLSWPEFYLLVCVSCIPCLLLLLCCPRHFRQISEPIEPAQRHEVVARA